MQFINKKNYENNNLIENKNIIIVFYKNYWHPNYNIDESVIKNIINRMFNLQQIINK